MAKGPIVVEPTPGSTLLLVGIRQIALVLGGVIIAARFIHDRDFAGLMDWLQGDGFAAAVLGALAIWSFIYGQLREWRNKIESLVLASFVPDEIGFVGRKIRWWRRLLGRTRKG